MDNEWLNYIFFTLRKAKVEKEIVEQTQQSLYDQLDFEELESLDNIEGT